MNLKYLGYNIIKTDYKKLYSFIRILKDKRDNSYIYICIDLLRCLFKYNTRFIDYFYFKFYDPNINKTEHTNVWDMHLFHKKYNSENAIIFRDKLKFRSHFKDYFNYPYFELKNIDDIGQLINWITVNNFQYIVAKEPLGTVGDGVKVLSIENEKGDLFIDGLIIEEYLNKLYHKGFILYESFINQHLDLSKIYPKSINTIRIVTFLNDENNVEIWAALLRMGLNKSVDNFDAGGISAKIDIESGIVIKPAVIKDPFIDEVFEYHPVTKEKILGLQIPYWEKVLKLINEASKEIPDVRTVGWDVAITINGPTLIEGNDNWDKTHFELTSGEGLNKRIKSLI